MLTSQLGGQRDREMSSSGILRRAAVTARTRPVPATPAGDARLAGLSIRIPVPQCNLNNGHGYLRQHLGFFPHDAIGGSSARDAGRALSSHFAAGVGIVTTDLDGMKGSSAHGDRGESSSLGPSSELARRS